MIGPGLPVVPVPAVDSSTGAQNVVDYEHHEIHSGSSFRVETYDPDLDGTDVLSIAFKTPDTNKRLHFVPIVTNSSGSLFELLEGATVTNGTGSDLVIFNKDRDSVNVSEVVSIKATPVAGQANKNATITDPGTVIQQQVIGSGKEKVGGSTRGTQEWILKADTVYVMRLTGISDNGSASMIGDWYEH